MPRSPLEIRGAPALRLELLDTRDPIEIGDQTTYEIRVTNQGSLDANGIDIVATLPKEMRGSPPSVPPTASPVLTAARSSSPTQDGLAPGRDLAHRRRRSRRRRRRPIRRRSPQAPSLGPEPVKKTESTNVFSRANGRGAAAPAGRP